MFDLTDLLAVVGLFTALKFVASLLREWRDATRLVPIGSITPSMVSEYKTVPLCFVGSDTLLGKVITYIYGRLWIRPMARKQAVLCDRIVLLSSDRRHQPRHEAVKAGMIIQATLSEGEFSPHIRRSARRCNIGNELVLAMVFPTENRQGFESQVRCIAVRARARPARDRAGRVPSRVIDWEVIDPAGVGSRVDTLREWCDVPYSSFWLVSQETDRAFEPVRPRLGRVFYAYGSSRPRGFVSLCVTSIIKFLPILLAYKVADIAEVAKSSPSIYLTLGLMSISLAMVFFYNVVRYVVARMSSEWVITMAPTVHKRLSAFGMWMTTLHHRLEWHGSTLRSLAVGNRLRGVDFWQQFRFTFWEPFVDWLRRKSPLSVHDF